VIKKLIGIVFGVVIIGFAGFFIGRASTSSESHIFELGPTPIPTPLTKYTMENLQQASVAPSQFEKLDTITDSKNVSTYAFAMHFDPTLKGITSEKVTGVVNAPKADGTFPLIVMIRGFVDQSIYSPGVGTKNAATYFAEHGFITIAPDFLGYAGSDSESEYF